MKPPFILLTVLLFATSQLVAQVNFPSGYAGEWTGKLIISNPGLKQKSNVTMVLKIEPTNSVDVWLLM